MQNQLLHVSKNINCRFSVAIGSLLVSTTVVAAWYKNTTRCDATKQNQQDEGHTGITFRIESHLMDRIQQKKYLSNAKDAIPSTFRVLAIDVPEMRTKAFTGECRLSHDKVFLDGVAFAKIIDVLDNRSSTNINTKQNTSKRTNSKESTTFSSSENIDNETVASTVNQTKFKIAQKALIKSIVHCSSPQSQQHVGVELLEASISDLNRYKLRKKQSFGNYTYDPLKYNNNDDDAIDEVDENESPLDKAILDESEAPWNQYAWMEELRLRIEGQVHYDEPLEKSPVYRYLFDNHQYKSTVPAVYKVWDFFMPFSFAKSDPNGIDGRNQRNVRACNKPHAVIANGCALQLVPSSLRLLQKLCKKADVPLFVVYDSRQWGGNTQASLPEALIAMRSTVKNRVIENALKQQGSSAFTRGRMLGQVETEATWQLKNKTKRAKELLGLEAGRRRKIEKEDWSQYDTDALESKLIERKVILVEGNDNDGSERKNYSPEFVEISKQCIYNQREEIKNTNTIPSENMSKEKATTPLNEKVSI